MLSYRHAYHAGNFADVMKHVVLTTLLRYMTQKDAPVCYIDTHAGAGSYDLQAEYAKKTSESDMGIGRLFDASDAPEPVAAYLTLVHRFNPGDALVRYPGSPRFAAEVRLSAAAKAFSEGSPRAMLPGQWLPAQHRPGSAD